MTWGVRLLPSRLCVLLWMPVLGLQGIVYGPLLSHRSKLCTSVSPSNGWHFAGHLGNGLKCVTGEAPRVLAPPWLNEALASTHRN